MREELKIEMGRAFAENITLASFCALIRAALWFLQIKIVESFPASRREKLFECPS